MTAPIEVCIGAIFGALSGMVALTAWIHSHRPTLSAEDRARLRPLLENAIAEAVGSLAADDGVQPDAPRSLERAVSWAQGLLWRIR